AGAVDRELWRTAGAWADDRPGFDASRIALPLSTQARAWLVVGAAPVTGPMPAWLWEHALVVLDELAARRPDRFEAPWREAFLRVVGTAVQQPLPLDDTGRAGTPAQEVQRERVLAVLRVAVPDAVRGGVADAPLRALIDVVAVWADPARWRYQNVLDEVLRRLPADP